MSRDAWIALIAAAALVLNGCGGQPATPAKYVIAVIPKGRTHQFWQSIERGARRAAADFDAQGLRVDILWEGPLKESDARDQIALVQQFAGRKIHGLVLAPQHSKAMVPVVKETHDRGIPVVVIDSGLDDPDLYVKYVATDNYNGGKLAAEHLLGVLAKDGKKAPKLVLLRYQAGSESTEQREKGFLDRVRAEAEKQKKAGEPTVEVISENVEAGATVDTAQAAAGPLLVQFKERMDGIFAVNESAATGLLNAMRSQGLLKDRRIRVMGFDTSDPLLQSLRDGELDGTIAQDPYRMGYLGVHAVVRHNEGDDVSGKDRNLSTGEVVITAANVDSEETRALVEPALQRKRTIDPPKYPTK